MTPVGLSESELDLWAELAAIREYLGGYSRETAESLALQDVLRKAGGG